MEKNLREHEKFLLDTLVSTTIPDEILSEIKESPDIVDYDVTGCGYFLTVKLPIYLEKEKYATSQYSWGNRVTSEQVLSFF